MEQPILAEAVRAIERGDLAAARALLPIDSADGLALRAALETLAGNDPREWLERALALAPRHPYARYQLALERVRCGDRQGAIARLRDLSDAALPELLAERVRAQLYELVHAGALRPLDRCAVPLWPPLSGSSSAPKPTLRGAPMRVGAERVAAAIAGRRLVALSGAGLSLASGLPTRKQMWRQMERERAVSAVGFRHDPDALWRAIDLFYGPRRPAPNPAHLALAALGCPIVTQNVDGLHQQAGSTDVIELHGSLARLRCHDCGAAAAGDSFSISRSSQAPATAPRCHRCRGWVRPDVVLFGERVAESSLRRAARLCRDAEVLLVVGTAADVAPAATLVGLCRGTIIEVKHQPSRLHQRLATWHWSGPAEELLPQLL